MKFVIAHLIKSGETPHAYKRHMKRLKGFSQRVENCFQTSKKSKISRITKFSLAMRKICEELSAEFYVCDSCCAAFNEVFQEFLISFLFWIKYARENFLINAKLR